MPGRDKDERRHGIYDEVLARWRFSKFVTILVNLKIILYSLYTWVFILFHESMLSDTYLEGRETYELY